MKTKFMVDGSNVHVFKMNEDTSLDELPPKVYSIRHNPIQGFYLEMTKDKLSLPSKIYGNTQKRVDRCIDTYVDRFASTGILLTGDKGTGKTLMMSLLANDVMSKLSMPVILINDPYSGSQFTTFIQSIGECCLVFDEFGKVYSARGNDENNVPQKSLLSLMDGVDKTKRLIVLTENSEIDINEFMLNRPSRIYYHFRYNKLDEESIKGYSSDHGVDKNIINDIIELSRYSKIFSFDMLQSIVEEHLRFSDSIDTVVEDLNIDVTADNNDTLKIIKIIEKSSNEERELFEGDVIPFPTHYSYIKLKLKENENCDEGGEPFYEFHINQADLSYESKDKSVYDTNLFTVVAEVIPAPRTSFYNLL